MKQRHMASLETVDDLRTVVRCEQCSYVALAVVEHLELDDDGNEVLVPLNIDVIDPGEGTEEAILWPDGTPFLDDEGSPVFRTRRPSHPAMFGGAPDDNRVCRLN